MVPEDLLFWIAPISDGAHDDRNVLCRRHADAMSVPRGWTLDDRREETPRLFMATRFDDPDGSHPRPGRQRRRATAGPGEASEQLVIDGTGEIDRPVVAGDQRRDGDREPHRDRPDGRPAAPWSPPLDDGSDLDGLLEVSSPLLARAFRGTDRRRS